MSKEWRPVVGYEGYYGICEDGEVRSLDRIIKTSILGKPHIYTKEGRTLSPNSKGSMYLRVQLSKDSTTKKHYIHRLVAQAFLENPNNLPCVNHIDGNKFNNHWTNLKWCTHKENNQHAKDTGLNSMYGEGCHLSKLSSYQVLEICNKLDSLDLAYSEIADEYGVTPENISYIDRGKTWKSITNRK